VITTLAYRGKTLPVRACYLGSEEPNVPVLAFIGGVHGVERIGSQVILAFLETLVERLKWDKSLLFGLRHLRLLFIPIVNPVGVINQTRANKSGIDLMRNAPIEAQSQVPFLVGGHHLSSKLPWYRGKRNTAMEPEAQALCTAVQQQLLNSPFTILLDVHSGYGFKDQLWFPLASSHEPIEVLPEIYALHQLLNKTYPHLNYVFEPQSHQYLTHGDLWDYVYLQNPKTAGIFLPLTLEMGSWNWIKKNPLQITRFSGLFHPTKPHRTQRVLRRHTVLLEFLIRATRAYSKWIPQPDQREHLRQLAISAWYSVDKD